jgi:hypothetical protein
LIESSGNRIGKEESCSRLRGLANLPGNEPRDVLTRADQFHAGVTLLAMARFGEKLVRLDVPECVQNEPLSINVHDLGVIVFLNVFPGLFLCVLESSLRIAGSKQNDPILNRCET